VTARKKTVILEGDRGGGGAEEGKKQEKESVKKSGIHNFLYIVTVSNYREY
jgi:hypothetical protein